MYSGSQHQRQRQWLRKAYLRPDWSGRPGGQLRQLHIQPVAVLGGPGVPARGAEKRRGFRR